MEPCRPQQPDVVRIGGGFEIGLCNEQAELYQPVPPVNLSAAGVCFVTDQPLVEGDCRRVRIGLLGPKGMALNHWELSVLVQKADDLPDGRRVVEGSFLWVDAETADQLAGHICRQAHSIAEFLGEFPLFSDFSRQELLELTQSISPVHVGKRRVLFYEGNEDPRQAGLYIIRHGSVKIFKGRYHDNPDRTLAVLTPGEVFGEMSLVEPGPHHGTVMALAPAHLLLISPFSFAVLRERRPAVALKLVELIARVLVRRLCRTTTRLFGPVCP